MVFVQNNLKRVKHVTNQGSKVQDPKLVSEEFRLRYACYCRDRRLLQRLIDHELPTLIDYTVRVHLLNCYRCRRLYSELKDLSSVRQKAEDATEFYRNLAQLSVDKKGESPTDNRELVDEQRMLIDEANNVLERLRKKTR